MNDSDRLWLDLSIRDPRAFTKIILDMDIDWDKLDDIVAWINKHEQARGEHDPK